MLTIDTSQTARFLSALSSDNRHTFQTIDDAAKGDKSKVRPGLVKIKHGRFESLSDQLSSLNLKGAGVFVMVNQGDGLGREKKNVVGARALLLDLDGAPINPALAAKIPPDIVVETSPGKWHCYWIVVDMPLDMWPAAQKRLAQLLGGDPSVNDINRVARLPGFLHNKSGSVRSELIKCEDRPHTWSELVEAFEFTHHLILPNAIPEGERNKTIFKLAIAARKAGVTFEAQLHKAEKVNQTRFAEPLSEEELRRTVANAYAGSVDGKVEIPRDVLEHPAFLEMPWGPRGIIIAAYRKLNSFNQEGFTLAWSEHKDLWPVEETFERHRARAVESGLLAVVVEARRPVLGSGGKPKAAFYKLTIGRKNTPYETRFIGRKNIPPEALQPSAVRASKSLGSTAAIFGSHVTPSDDAQSGASNGVES